MGLSSIVVVPTLRPSFVSTSPPSGLLVTTRPDAEVRVALPGPAGSSGGSGDVACSGESARAASRRFGPGDVADGSPAGGPRLHGTPPTSRSRLPTPPWSGFVLAEAREQPGPSCGPAGAATLSAAGTRADVAARRWTSSSTARRCRRPLPRPPRRRAGSRPGAATVRDPDADRHPDARGRVGPAGGRGLPWRRPGRRGRRGCATAWHEIELSAPATSTGVASTRTALRRRPVSRRRRAGLPCGRVHAFVNGRPTRSARPPAPARRGVASPARHVPLAVLAAHHDRRGAASVVGDYVAQMDADVTTDVASTRFDAARRPDARVRAGESHPQRPKCADHTEPPRVTAMDGPAGASATGGGCAGGDVGVASWAAGACRLPDHPWLLPDFEIQSVAGRVPSRRLVAVIGVLGSSCRAGGPARLDQGYPARLLRPGSGSCSTRRTVHRHRTSGPPSWRPGIVATSPPSSCGGHR